LQRFHLFFSSCDFPHEVTTESRHRDTEELLENEELTEDDKAAILASDAERLHRFSEVHRG
jgi:hypothetical protein